MVDFKNYSDQEILLELLNTDKNYKEAAWREFVRRFTPILASALKSAYRRFAPHLVVTNSDIDDHIQQIYIKMFTNDQVIRDFHWEKENSFKNWLFDIARNRVIDHL